MVGVSYPADLSLYQQAGHRPAGSPCEFFDRLSRSTFPYRLFFYRPAQEPSVAPSACYSMLGCFPCSPLHSDVAQCTTFSIPRPLLFFRKPMAACYPHPMETRCVNCSLPVECAAPSPECWCKSIPAWRPIREASPDCLCKICLVPAILVS